MKISISRVKKGNSIIRQRLFFLEGNNCHFVLFHIFPEINYFHDVAINSGIDKGMFQC